MDDKLRCLFLLAFERVKELGQDAMNARSELTKWRTPELDSKEKTDLIIKHDKALQKQHDWLTALEEVIEV